MTGLDAHPDDLDPHFEVELRRGLLTLLALLHLNEPRYGYELVRSLCDAGFMVEEGTLYPILRRLERQGTLESRWDRKGSRPRRYYSLSERGQQRRREMFATWERLCRTIERALPEGAARPARDSEPSTTAPEASP